MTPTQSNLIFTQWVGSAPLYKSVINEPWWKAEDLHYWTCMTARLALPVHTNDIFSRSLLGTVGQMIISLSCRTWTCHSLFPHTCIVTFLCFELEWTPYIALQRHSNTHWLKFGLDKSHLCCQRILPLELEGLFVRKKWFFWYQPGIRIEFYV